MPTYLISADGFKEYLLKHLTPDSANSYLSYLRNLRPASMNAELNGSDMLSYLCEAINSNPTESFIRALLNEVLKSAVADKDLLKTPSTLSNRLSALHSFSDYVEDTLFDEDDQDDEDDEDDEIDSDENADSAELPQAATSATRNLTTTGLQPIQNPPVPQSIKWIPVHTPVSNPFVSSSRQSIRNRFLNRLKTQSRHGGNSIQFPIREILSIFNHATKRVSTNGSSSVVNAATLQSYKEILAQTLSMLTDRILFYVKEQRPKAIGFTRLPDNMWAYTLASIEYLGVDAAGQIFIRLFGYPNSCLQVYTHDFTTATWQPMINVRKLSKIHLDHDPEMHEILNHLISGLTAMQALKNLGITNSTKIRQIVGTPVWPQVLQLLPQLYEETLRVLSFYNLDAILGLHNSAKQSCKTKATKHGQDTSTSPNSPQGCSDLIF